MDEKNLTNQSRPEISIVVPAHNEEENLIPLVEKLQNTLQKDSKKREYEIVLVDDNSTDGTPALVDKLANEHPRIRAVHRYKDGGFGNAVKRGLREAQGKFIVPVMADLSEEPEDILKLVDKLEEGYDIAYGSRFCKGGSVEGYPRLKLIVNRFGNHLIRFLFGISHKDITNAFKAYRREVLEAVGIENLKSSDFSLTIEIPLKAHILGFKSAEVPVRWYGRQKGEAKLKLSEHCHKYGFRLLQMFFQGNQLALRELFASIVGKSKKRSILYFLLGLGLVLALIHLAGLANIQALIFKISPYFILASLGAILSSFILRTWRWSVLLRSCGYREERSILFKSILSGWFLNYLLPFRLGDAARALSLKTTRHKPLLISFFTIVLERLMDLAIFSLVLAYAWGRLSFSKEQYTSLLWIGVAVALAIGFTILLWKYEKWLLKCLPKFLFDLQEELRLFPQAARSIFQNPFALALCFAITVGIWFFEIASLYFIGKGLGLDLPFWESTLAGISAFLAQAFPTIPAGLGIHEAAIASTLYSKGIPFDQGLSLALLDHFCRMLVIFGLGLVATIHLGFESRHFFHHRSRAWEKVRKSTKSKPQTSGFGDE